MLFIFTMNRDAIEVQKINDLEKIYIKIAKVAKAIF
jgi:hypothetical protein